MDLDAYADLSELVRLQLAAFSGHGDYLKKRFAADTGAELAYADKIAGLIRLVAAADAPRFCADYQWLTERVLEEELQFRRNGRYRLSRHSDATEQVYSNREYMSRYMNGLLLTQLWWRNHTRVLEFFSETYLPLLPQDFSHLEIGPGHGLFLYLAGSAGHCGRLEGWDISDASITNTSDALARLGGSRKARLLNQDIFAAPSRQFDSVVCSEVLEHLEEPQKALDVLFGLTARGGRAFINAPVNSPAPDHIHLYRTPEEVVDMVVQAGFAIEQTCFASCTGSSLERARRLGLSISAAVIARKPDPKPETAS